MDIFIGTGNEIRFTGMRFDDLERESNPVNQISENVLIDWCEINPEIRYLQLVSSLQTCWKTKETDELSWKPIIFSILEKAPNIREVLSILQGTFHPMAWFGSYADTLGKRLILFTSLHDHPNPMVRDWAKGQNLKLQRVIKEERENELRRNQKRFERFE